jgi:hypothetical protein
VPARCSESSHPRVCRVSLAVGQHFCRFGAVCVCRHAVARNRRFKQLLGSPFRFRCVAQSSLHSSSCTRECVVFQPNALVFLTVVAGFGKCSLPSRQVALFGLSLIATVVYLRWKESQPKLGSSGRATHVSHHLAFFRFVLRDSAFKAHFFEALDSCGANPHRRKVQAITKSPENGAAAACGFPR